MSYQFDIFGNLQTKSAQELAAIENAADTIIVLEQGITGNGKPYWAYIAVQPSCYVEYIRAAKAHKTIGFSDYGTILRYGFDKEVTTYVKDKIKQQYGFDENYNEKLVREIEQARSQFLQERDKNIDSIVDMLKNQSAGE